MARISFFETTFLPEEGWKCKVTFDDGDYGVYQLLENGVRLVARTGFLTREEFLAGLEKAREEFKLGQIFEEVCQAAFEQEMEKVNQAKKAGWNED